MTIQTSSVALQRAHESKTNKPGMCQQWTRTLFDAPSAGDRDKDGDADAADGYFSEPISARHPGDRNPPPGKPLYFSKAGGAGNGHRALSDDKAGYVVSIDMSDAGGKYQPGNVGVATIAQIEKAMGVSYVGWTNTIDGYPIPPEKPVERRKQRPKNVRVALDALRAELRSTDVKHKRLVDEAKKALLQIPPS